MSQQTVPGKDAPRQRKAVVPPKKVTKNMSLFEYLSQCQPPVDKKIIDIACSQTQVPPELKEDAAQEIRIMWSQMKPDIKRYKPGQIASYAHGMARHAALRLRRQLGSSVCLPGSAFRKRKDGSSYVTPGVLAAALDWNELESWFDTDNVNSVDAAGLGVNNLVLGEGPDVALEDAPEEAIRNERMERLNEHKDELTPRQYNIMKALIEGATYEEVMAENGIKKGVLMREMAVAGALLGPMEY